MITGDEKRPGGDRPPEKDSGHAWMTIARENVVTARGFALLPGAIVDQHFVRRRRQNRLLSLVLENPTLVGVGIDESTALEVGPDGVWRVLGESVAVVFDARKADLTPARRPGPGRRGGAPGRPARREHLRPEDRHGGASPAKTFLNRREARRPGHTLPVGVRPCGAGGEHAQARPVSRHSSRGFGDLRRET